MRKCRTVSTGEDGIFSHPLGEKEKNSKNVLSVGDNFSLKENKELQPVTYRWDDICAALA